MVGQFKDDQLQTHGHYVVDSYFSVKTGYGMSSGSNAGIGDKLSAVNGDRYWVAKDVYSGRQSTTTHGKQKGVKYIIKVL